MSDLVGVTGWWASADSQYIVGLFLVEKEDGFLGGSLSGFDARGGQWYLHFTGTKSGKKYDLYHTKAKAWPTEPLDGEVQTKKVGEISLTFNKDGTIGINVSVEWWISNALLPSPLPPTTKRDKFKLTLVRLV